MSVLLVQLSSMVLIVIGKVFSLIQFLEHNQWRDMAYDDNMAVRPMFWHQMKRELT